MTTQSLALLTACPESGLAERPSFRWADVPTSEREWLRKRTEDVENFAYRTACDLIRIGQVLAQVRAKLPKRFTIWLAAETPFSTSHAYRLIATAGAFGKFVSQIEKVEPSALYLLAQKETPPAARDYAVKVAESGQRVTRAVALSILDAYKPVSVSADEVREYEQLKEKLDERVVDGRAVDQEGITRRAEAQDQARLLKIGREVERLAERETMLSISKLDDAEDVVLYSVTCHGPDHGPRNVVDRLLDRALAEVGGEVATKYCAGCDRRKPTNQFGTNRRLTDLLMGRCKECEKARKRVRRERIRSERAAPRAEAA